MSVQKRRGSNLENRSLYHHWTLSKYLEESQEFENTIFKYTYAQIHNSKN